MPAGHKLLSGLVAEDKQYPSFISYEFKASNVNAIGDLYSYPTYSCTGVDHVEVLLKVTYNDGTVYTETKTFYGGVPSNIKYFLTEKKPITEISYNIKFVNLTSKYKITRTDDKIDKDYVFWAYDWYIKNIYYDFTTIDYVMDHKGNVLKDAVRSKVEYTQNTKINTSYLPQYSEIEYEIYSSLDENSSQQQIVTLNQDTIVTWYYKRKYSKKIFNRMIQKLVNEISKYNGIFKNE